MTHDEILHLAEQVGCGWERNGTEPVLIHLEKIVAFAALVASAERETSAHEVTNDDPQQPLHILRRRQSTRPMVVSEQLLWPVRPILPRVLREGFA